MNAAPISLPVRSCARCCWYAASLDKRVTGTCRRNPPQMLVVPQADALGRVQVQVMADFPSVRPDSWCGEFAETRGWDLKAGPMYEGVPIEVPPSPKAS